ncbi:MAG: TRAP transporter small permease [Bacteroidales bacterium]|nr:TRAP transporter small permease [Bacteroidales bacterium]
MASRIVRWLDEHLEEALLAILLAGIAFVVLFQVIARYVFSSPLGWSDELARYFLVWSTFLSASYCVRHRISIKIDQFQNSLNAPLIPWVKMLRHTIVFAFCVIMIPYAWKYVAQAAFNGSTSPALRIPMYYLQSAPLAGFILLGIRVAQAWFREFRISRSNLLESLKETVKEKEGRP